MFEARDICVRYGEENVLEDVSLVLAEGEFVGIVGPNGGGKSTLLRALLGLVPVHCGEVRVYGEDLRRFRDRSRIGYVPQHVITQDLRLFPATAFEVALLGRVAKRGLLRRFTSEDKERARAALRTVGMDVHADRRLGELSGGQRQRVFLAKALASEPDVLLLDEPTTGVDPAARQSFFELLDCLNHDDGKTVVLVSHDTQAIALSAHRLLAVNRRLVFDGPPGQLDAHGGFHTVYDMALTHDHDHPGDARAARP